MSAYIFHTPAANPDRLWCRCQQHSSQCQMNRPKIMTHFTATAAAAATAPAPINRDHFCSTAQTAATPCVVARAHCSAATTPRTAVVVVVTVGYTGESNVAVGLGEHFLRATAPGSVWVAAADAATALPASVGRPKESEAAECCCRLVRPSQRRIRMCDGAGRTMIRRADDGLGCHTLDGGRRV
uniref:Uncharacterized protein n=1 Tax=Anopheles farauti TaxID=69004 RepID=A0A182QGJ5_9DIPT